MLVNEHGDDRAQDVLEPLPGEKGRRVDMDEETLMQNFSVDETASRERMVSDGE